MENVQVISGRLFLKEKTGSADFSFRDHAVVGQAEADGVILGPQNVFNSVPHVIVSLNDANLSTSGNTSFQVNRTANRDSLRIDWTIDRAGGTLKVDFLAIGEPGI